MNGAVVKGELMKERTLAAVDDQDEGFEIVRSPTMALGRAKSWRDVRDFLTTQRLSRTTSSPGFLSNSEEEDIILTAATTGEILNFSSSASGEAKGIRDKVKTGLSHSSSSSRTIPLPDEHMSALEDVKGDLLPSILDELGVKGILDKVKKGLSHSSSSSWTIPPPDKYMSVLEDVKGDLLPSILDDLAVDQAALTFQAEPLSPRDLNTSSTLSTAISTGWKHVQVSLATSVEIETEISATDYTYSNTDSSDSSDPPPEDSSSDTKVHHSDVTEPTSPSKYKALREIPVAKGPLRTKPFTSPKAAPSPRLKSPKATPSPKPTQPTLAASPRRSFRGMKPSPMASPMAQYKPTRVRSFMRPKPFPESPLVRSRSHNIPTPTAARLATLIDKYEGLNLSDPSTDLTEFSTGRLESLAESLSTMSPVPPTHATRRTTTRSQRYGRIFREASSTTDVTMSVIPHNHTCGTLNTVNNIFDTVAPIDSLQRDVGYTSDEDTFSDDESRSRNVIIPEEYGTHEESTYRTDARNENGEDASTFDDASVGEFVRMSIALGPIKLSYISKKK